MESKIINHYIREAGFDQTVIAEVLACSPSLVSKVINRRATSTRIAKSIAKILKRPLLEVFPEYAHLEKRNSATRHEKVQSLKQLLTSEDTSFHFK